MKNNFDDIIFEDSSFFECFDGVECDKNLFLKIWNNRYAALVHESKIKFNLETINDWSESDIFFLIPIDSLKSTHIDLSLRISHSSVKVNVHMVSFVRECPEVVLNWSVIMSEGIQNSSVSLLEESIILSDKVKIKNLPLLDICSKNIMASHGAKIYRLDWDKLFYLESKWLDPRKAKWILLSSYVEKLFSWIKLDGGEKSQLYEEYFYFF